MPADRRNVSNARTPLTPEEVSRRSFSSAFRGFDQTEVRDFLIRASDELQAAADREAQLLEQLADAEARAAAPPVITENMVTSFLGAEASRVLKSAHDAAHDIESKAEEATAKQRQAIENELAQSKRQAEEAFEARKRAAEAEALAIREAAERDAESVREQARQHGRQMLTDAQQLRAKVLNDLARRRKIAHAQVEQLRAGRLRLIDAYRVVRGSLDDVSVELERAEIEARQAAELAAKRVAEEAEITAEDFEAALGMAAEPESLNEPGSTDEVLELDAAFIEPLPELSAQNEASAPADPKAEAAPSLKIVGRSARSKKSSPTDQSAPAGPSKIMPVAEPLPEEGVKIIREEVAPVSATESADAQPVDEAAKDEAPAAEHPKEMSEAKVKTKAAGLFARMKAERARSVEDAESVVKKSPSPADVDGEAPDAEAPATEAPATEAPDTQSDVVADTEVAVAAAEEVTTTVDVTDEALQDNAASAETETSSTDAVVASAEQADTVDETPATEDAASADDVDLVSLESSAEAILARNEVIDPLRKSMTRLLKRTLQDEQNDVLNRLSLQKGKISAASLPDREEQISRYQRAIEKTIRIAMDHGVSSTGLKAKPKPLTTATEAVASEAANDLVGPLLDRLSSTIDAAVEKGGDNVERSAMDAVGATYREWKSKKVEALAGDALASAYAQGVFLAIPKGQAVQWVMDASTRCPECQQNVNAGEVAKGDKFPSGHTVPPMHPGCRCVLAQPQNVPSEAAS